MMGTLQWMTMALAASGDASATASARASIAATDADVVTVSTWGETSAAVH